MSIVERAQQYLANVASGELPLDDRLAKTARAYAYGISADIATDAADYVVMTLDDIAEEWRVADPIQLLAVLADALNRGRLQQFPRVKP
jgi:hypothetical protein